MVGADYALLRRDGSPLALVEAKKLMWPMDETLQILSDAIQENRKEKDPPNIRFCVWTDGNSWMLYNLRESDSSGLMMSANIAGKDYAETASKLQMMSREILSDGSVTLAAEKVAALSAPDDFRPPSIDWMPLTMVTDPTGRSGPSEIRLPNGDIKKTSTWKNLLIETVLYLHASERFAEQTFEYRLRGGRRLIRETQEAGAWESFMSPVLLRGTNIILETKFNADQIVRLAKNLMRMHGMEPSKIILKFERVPINRRQRSRAI